MDGPEAISPVEALLLRLLVRIPTVGNLADISATITAVTIGVVGVTVVVGVVVAVVAITVAAALVVSHAAASTPTTSFAVRVEALQGGVHSIQ